MWSRRTGCAPPDTPFALVTRGPHGLALSAVNEAARRAGVAVGQKQADAQAALPALLTEPARPRADAVALRRLALWAERYSPIVAVDETLPGREGLLLDMTGAAHLFGGERALLDGLAARLAAAAIPARLALADTAGAAWALARHRPGTIAPPGDRALLAALPVAGLRLGEADLRLLRRFGLGRIGDLLALPRPGLARRFSPTLPRRLDQALGREDEALAPLRPPATYRARRVFADPVTDAAGADPLLIALAEALVRPLRRDGKGARRLRLTGLRTDGAATSLAMALSLPSADPVHIAQVLRRRGLEHLDLGPGIDALVLEADRAEPIALAQTRLDGAPDATEFAALIDRLTARLGEGAVFRRDAAASWVPERGERRVSPLAPPASALPRPAADRPLLLLDPPEPVEAIADIPEGPPARFTWRRKPRRVVRAQGPERIAPEWWRPDAGYTRDYYKLEDSEGRRYWVFRAGLYGRAEEPSTPGWWMHGLFP